MTRTTAKQLDEMWQRSDQIFDLLRPGALYDQPIALRHPFIFYLGHLPAFAWNQVCRGILDMPSFRPEFDELFERGIDPMDADSHDSTTSWPDVEEVLAYRDRVRQELLDAVDRLEVPSDAPLSDGSHQILDVAIEHELMHQETLQYMLQQMADTSKREPSVRPALQFDGAAPPEIVEVEGGPVVLGADPEAPVFGWDNEFPRFKTEVEAFAIDRTPVRNGEFLEFVADDGYRRPELWHESDWDWRERNGLHCPVFWSHRDGEWSTHTLFERIPLERAAEWPVFVSLAEARAYCRWRGARLATEAEMHRAAYTAPDGSRRPYPWGDDPPGPEHGNFDFRHWAPTPAGAFPDGDSAWGLADVVGNGWEWTDSIFAPFPGFQVTVPTYPGYSADFFDDRHFVMLGASWATPARLIRRSFRNWFHAHYPYVFAKFRCVHER